MAGLKTEAALRGEIARRLSRTFAEDVAGASESWPHAFSVGRPGTRELLAGLDGLNVLIRTLRAWDQELGTATTYAMREAGGPKRVPTHVTVPTADVAARLATPRAGEGWPRVLARARERDAMLRERFGTLDADARAKVLRAQDGCDDLEFELLVTAGAWFARHDARGLTPREVPLPGIDAKWLGNARRMRLLCLLAGRDELGLARRAGRMDFAYLDPGHLADGGRRYDSWVEGDACVLPYVPEVAVIVENKDTYLNFLPVAGGLCVFGAGKAGVALASAAPCVTQARRVVYWGDLDADGFEILNAYRERGLVCESILMDEPTLRRYERFGTNVEKDHRTRIVRQRRDLPLLTAAERAAYELLTSETYTGHRRVEQERIPLAVAQAALP